MISFHTVALTLIFFNQFTFGKSTENIFDRIKSGFKMAGDFLSSDHANKVANLVSNFLGGKSTKRNDEEKTNNIFSGFLRLFGFKTRQISVIAVNAIILVAQLIGSSLLNTPPTQKLKDINEDNPFEWMVKNFYVSQILADTEDQNLSEKVIDYVTERSHDEETGCVQLLICKMKPFISEMQRALKEKDRGGVKGYGDLFEYFPNASVIADNGDKCEKKYYYCSIPL